METSISYSNLQLFEILYIRSDFIALDKKRASYSPRLIRWKRLENPEQPESNIKPIKVTSNENNKQ